MEIKVLSVYFVIGFICVTAQRDKRTLDLVLRSVADVFGYDIQKRPTVLPPPSSPAPKSTIFPPPVAPLPASPRALAPPPPPPPPLKAAPRIPAPNPPTAGPPRKQPVPPPRAPPPPPPPPPRAPPPPPPPKPALKIPAPPPPRPPPPRPPAPVPSQVAPAPPPPKAQAPQPAANPVLTESIRKTFNLNFNWDRSRQPINAAAPASPPQNVSPAPAPPPPPPPRKPLPPPNKIPIMPAAPPPAPPAAPPAAPPPPPPPPPSAPAPPPPRLPPPSARKPQLYNDYDSINSNEAYQNDYVDSPDYVHTLPYKNSEDQYASTPEYYDYQNQDISNDYKNQPEKNEENNYEDSKDRFKDSIKTFWEKSPWITNQHGLKFIIAPEEPEEYENVNDYPTEVSKYEEYEIIEDRAPKQYKNDNNTPNNGNKYNDKYSSENDYNDAYASKKQYTKSKKYRKNNNDKKGQEKLNEQSSSNKEIVQPLYSGVLPAQLHEIYKKDKNTPWPAPFDIHFSASEKKSKLHQQYEDQEVDEDKENMPFLIRTYRQAAYNYVPENYNEDYNYEVPEPSTENYEKILKINYDDDDEEEKDLSKNAKIRTKEYGKKFTLLSTNKDSQAI